MNNRSGRLVLRFRLQTLLVLITTFAIVLGLVGNELRRERRKKQDALEVLRLGGRVHFDRTPDHESTGVVNGYLRLVLGDEYFSVTESVSLNLRTAEDLDILRSFPETKMLSLAGTPVDDESLARLHVLDRLEHLGLSDTTLSEAGVKTLRTHPNLNSFGFSNCSLTDGALAALAEFPGLRGLSLRDCRIPDRFLNAVMQPSDRVLMLIVSPLTDSDLEVRQGARSAGELRLFNVDVTEAGMLAFRAANPGWSVRFSSDSPAGKTRQQAHGFLPSVEELPHSITLAFQGALTSDATLEALQDASGLISLEFSECPLTDGGLPYLRPLQKLQRLSISGSAITDEGLPALAGLVSLQTLSLYSTNVEGDGLGNLPASIIRLSVMSSKLTDRAATEVAKLTSLEELTLSSPLLSDQAIDSLASMSSLRKLRLGGESIGEAELERLRQALPDCEVSK